MPSEKYWRECRKSGSLREKPDLPWFDRPMAETGRASANNSIKAFLILFPTMGGGWLRSLLIDQL